MFSKRPHPERATPPAMPARRQIGAGTPQGPAGDGAGGATPPPPPG
ncbi:MAG: hypothetical protein QOD86_2249, partial [Miltoncostaeaceae bacterium]|nr:hypothetical protein [Miltoncostaeaceae bacterium]